MSIELLLELREDLTFSAGDDLLPAVEEAELDEVVVQQRRAAREAHPSRALHDSRHLKPVTLQQFPNRGHGGTVRDVLVQREQLILQSATCQYLFEDRVELLHVSLEVRRQRQSSAVPRDAPAFADGAGAIVEVVEPQVRHDQVEVAVREGHRRS